MGDQIDASYDELMQLFAEIREPKNYMSISEQENCGKMNHYGHSDPATLLEQRWDAYDKVKVESFDYEPLDKGEGSFVTADITYGDPRDRVIGRSMVTMQVKWMVDWTPDKIDDFLSLDG